MKLDFPTVLAALGDTPDVVLGHPLPPAVACITTHAVAFESLRRVAVRAGKAMRKLGPALSALLGQKPRRASRGWRCHVRRAKAMRARAGDRP